MTVETRLTRSRKSILELANTLVNVTKAYR
jgi:hypothetical protein